MLMAISFTLPNYQRNVKLQFSKQAVGSRVAIVCFASSLHQTTALGQKLHSKCSFYHVAHPSMVENSKRMTWSIGSNVDSSGFDPSPANSPNGGTRLIRAIRTIQTKIGARIQEIRKDLPTKLLFFLVGFYCATAFATVIGQTGDWDILSAALAVVVVEGIGALMYRASLPLVSKIKSLITMFNYWKAGLSLGLFLDSFKYGMDDIFGSSNPFTFEIDLFHIIF
ncbi:hypothetical protein F2P56_016872 [Juglans regia]|uniref:Ycf20-like protein n=2 Tax=Juglans regia TaxID=51240 RepID=A0A833XJT3_JUGRE|nr:uncharacterized protein LOC109007367 [Juglans regia]KAF5466996.1 hypothetical protein F2P56_016872 [Juglans regia]